MVGGDLAFHGELGTARFDEVPDLEELLVYLVVDGVLLRPFGEQIHRRQKVVRQLELAAHAFLRLAHRRPRDLRLFPHFHRNVFEERIFEIVLGLRHGDRHRLRHAFRRSNALFALFTHRHRRVEHDRQHARGALHGRRGVELEGIARVLLRQRFGSFAQIGLGDFADLEAAAPVHLAHDRAAQSRLGRDRVVRSDDAGIRRCRRARDEPKLRSLRLLQVLAHDGVLHLLFAPALGEASPLQGDGAAEGDELAMDGQKDQRQADARGEQQPDQQCRDQGDGRAAGVHVAADGAIDLLPEVAAGGDQ